MSRCPPLEKHACEPHAKLAEAVLIGTRWSERQRSVFGASWKSLAITGRIVCSPQIGLDSKTPVLIVLWKDAHAVGMFSVKALLAAMIERLALKVIGLADI